MDGVAVQVPPRVEFCGGRDDRGEVGYERVLVLSPLGGRTRHPVSWGMQLAAQVDDLRAGSIRVELIVPDSDSLTRSAPI